MNNNSHNNNSSSSNSQQWMMNSDTSSEPYNNYMVTRPPGSVLPVPQHHSNQPMQAPRQEEESVSPPAQALDYDHPRYHKGGNRAVIPSKRAAQNRAAQKAFRQRREQYIKDLEIKAKEMEDWQDEMDKLKKENNELRERVVTLENQVSILTGGDPSKIPIVEQQQQQQQQQRQQQQQQREKEPESELSYPSRVERSMSLPDTPAKLPNEDIRRGSASPVNIPPQSVKRLHNESRLRHEQHEAGENNQQEGTFAPVPLRAPNQTGFDSTSYHPNDHTNPPSSNHTTIENKRRKLDSPPTQPTTNTTTTSQQIGQAPISSNSNYSSNTMIQNTNTSPSTSNPPILLPIRQQQPQQPQQQIPPEFWNPHLNTVNQGGGMGDFDLDFDFDPFFEEEFGPTITNSSDFLPNANSGQVLDDLFAMLQTRQRPQIPIIPTDENIELNNLNSNMM